MRFSIRDLLWLMLVVAMGLAWWLREGHWRIELDQSSARTQVWKLRAGALEGRLISDGYQVSWHDTSGVQFKWINRNFLFGDLLLTYYSDGIEPNAREPLVEP
jgi:hypothetical protein